MSVVWTHGWPVVGAPYLGVVEPAARHLATVDEQRGRDGDGGDPDAGDEQRRAACGDASLHREHDAEEPVARDHRQRQNARHQHQHCTAFTHTNHRLVPNAARYPISVFTCNKVV